MRENLSALMDDELDDVNAHECLSELKGSDELRQAWQEYHLIGDALRGSANLSVNVSARVGAALMQEPAILAPQPRPKPLKLYYALAASVALAGVVGWMVWQGGLSTGDAVQSIAVVSQHKPASRNVMFSPAERDSYLRAHHEVMLEDGLPRASLQQEVAH